MVRRISISKGTRGHRTVPCAASATGTPNTSFDKLYSGKAGDFQRTYYDFRGNISLQIDFTQHSNPLEHSYPHLHTWGRLGHSKQINLWYLEFIK